MGLRRFLVCFVLCLGNGARKPMGCEGVARRKKGLMRVAVVSTRHCYHEA